jgi:hypothetical protein
VAARHGGSSKLTVDKGYDIARERLEMQIVANDQLLELRGRGDCNVEPFVAKGPAERNEWPDIAQGPYRLKSDLLCQASPTFGLIPIPTPA